MPMKTPSASFELMARERSWASVAALITNCKAIARSSNFLSMPPAKGYTVVEATVKLRSAGGEAIMRVAEGNGPVNALDAALRKALCRIIRN